jgi:hypothetical protein
MSAEAATGPWQGRAGQFPPELLSETGRLKPR